MATNKPATSTNVEPCPLEIKSPAQIREEEINNYVSVMKMEFEARKATDPNFEEKIATNKVALASARKMLEANPNPSSALQVEIIKAATELIKVANMS